ncbi:hypothetical protein GCK32_008967 [Trichostrongylus colubriformis]|uniref:Uncharacterized protein n=1 Tax=Trichostrongylus colubriformis TaxID=6319 RepID=A0AAN8J2A1_TRICO
MIEIGDHSRLQNSTCESVVGAYELGYHMAQWTTAAMTGWQLRMIVDPVANIFLDRRFVNVRQQLCCPPLSAFEPNIVVRTNEHAGEFLRKCAAMNVMPISVITGGNSPTATVPPEVDPKAATRRVNHLRFDQRVL